MSDNNLSLVFVHGNQPATTTLNIAEGVGVQHKNVIALLRKHLPDFEEFGRVAFQTQPFATAGGEQIREVAVLNEHQATLLLTYSRNTDVVKDFKKRLVREFFIAARKAREPSPREQMMLPAQVGEETIKSMLPVANTYGVPVSYAMQIAAREATKVSGIAWDEMLTQAPVMDDVPIEDVMLEPTEIGKRLGMTAIQTNKWLESEGLQIRTREGWVATKEGAEISQRHAWTKNGKSGYNLKWKANAVEGLFNGVEQTV
jgi:phage regulator Rha-like protein